MRGVAQPYLGARAIEEPGDMMADGGETPDSSRPLILSGTLAPRSDDRRLAGASRGHQLNRAEARTGGHGSGCLLLLHLSRRQPDHGGLVDDDRVTKQEELDRSTRLRLHLLALAVEAEQLAMNGVRVTQCGFG